MIIDMKDGRIVEDRRPKADSLGDPNQAIYDFARQSSDMTMLAAFNKTNSEDLKKKDDT
jgi:hypothetical protein